MKIVLASASPRRAQLLKQINLEFTVSPSDIEEVMDENLSPERLVESLAQQKGESVLSMHPDSFIIAADTIVTIKGRYLGKPIDENDAEAMLQNLSTQTHEVYSGVYLALTNEKGIKVSSYTFSEETKVTFGALERSEIRKYVETGSPMDKAGSYGIQDDFGAVFVKKIEGDYNNVVGFPLYAFYQQIKLHFPKIFSQLFNHS
ncbi:Maf family protein [Rhodohalobacter sp.]|uniref:Maf family protein n=1 Tax=Rhodohalobacter sp. TaxID=1974210 RepID=UPI003562A654